MLLKNVTTVSLPSVMDPVAFESVLSSAYTGQLSLVHDDIVNYVTVASFLQMWHIVDKCTEILKRPRPPAEAPGGEAAGAGPRQQSPSSSDCLYLETESRKKERRPDALPPLATWRRPQQFPRWGRPRPPPNQQVADSQLDAHAAFPGDFGCEDAWDAKGYAFEDGARPRPGGGQRTRPQQRGGQASTGDGGETQDRRKDERRGTEADEGVGEEDEDEKDEGVSETGEDRLQDVHAVPL